MNVRVISCMLSFPFLFFFSLHVCTFCQPTVNSETDKTINTVSTNFEQNIPRRRSRSWLNGLVVWFSLWVREAPGSNPGWARESLVPVKTIPTVDRTHTGPSHPAIIAPQYGKSLSLQTMEKRHVRRLLQSCLETFYAAVVWEEENWNLKKEGAIWR